MRSDISYLTSKRKLTVWNSSLFRIGFTPSLRVLLGTHLTTISTKVKNKHIALYLRERGYLLLLISSDTGKPPLYCPRIPLTEVWGNLDSSVDLMVNSSNSPYLKDSALYYGQKIVLHTHKELKGVLLILKSEDEFQDENLCNKINPILRKINTLLSLVALLLSERQRSSRLRLINKISQRIDSLTDEDELYDGIVHQIQSSFGYDHVAIYLIKEEVKSLQMKALAGKYSKIIPKDQIIPLTKGIVGKVATSGRTHLSNVARHNPYFLNTTPDVILTEAELCVPIRVDGKIIGVLNIEHSELFYFDKDDISSVELLADIIGVASKNARLYSELRKSHMTLEAIASSTGYGIVMISKDFIVQWVNRTINKWGCENAVGKPCHLLFNKELAICKNCPGRSTFKTGKISNDIICSGDKFFTVTAIPITDIAGFISHVLEVIEDVTITRRTKEELESLKLELVQAQQLAAIGELAANVVHEIRNPMNAITQAMGILATNLMLNNDQEQLMNVLKEEFARLNDTLNTYHLLAHNKEERQFREGNLYSVIEKVVSLVQADHNIAHRIHFEIEKTKSFPTFLFDSNSMKQVFWNLLLNSVESIQETGKITIFTRCTPSNILISIEDNGRGIEEDQLSKIFEPFYTTKHQGAGLGLTIVRRIIEDHGWKITVENAIPKGARFTLLIPTA